MTQDVRQNIWAILLAGGVSERFQSTISKCFHLLDGRPVLHWSVASLSRCDAISRIIIVSHKDDIVLSKVICTDCTKPYSVIEGGSQREGSLAAALTFINSHAYAPDTVIVHDGARPLISQAVLHAMIGAIQTPLAKAVIPVLPVVDSLSEIQTNSGKDWLGPTSPRRSQVRIQTPQIYDRFTLNDVMLVHQKGAAQATASIPEWERIRARGLGVLTICGDNKSRKITYPDDLSALLPLAKDFWDAARGAASEDSHARPSASAVRQEMMTPRVSMGYDVHRTAKDRPLYLGGVRISDKNGLNGHSDADILLHALCDALYGLIGSGDIGYFFPPSDPKWKGAESTIFVKHALKHLQQATGRLTHVDCTLVVEKPRLSPFREAICQNLAAMLGLPVTNIAVKATTHEGLGCFGRGEGMAAMVIVNAAFKTVKNEDVT